jgi:hypothetical protein
MKIVAKNTQPLPSSFKFSEDGLSFTYMANTEIYVEGQPFDDLFTPKTVTGLTCLANNMANIQSVTETQVNAWVELTYPTV